MYKENVFEMCHSKKVSTKPMKMPKKYEISEFPDQTLKFNFERIFAL